MTNEMHHVLCTRARNNDQEAWDELWHLSQGSFRQVLRQFFLPRINDRDELSSTLQRAFCEAVQVWDPAGGMKFLGFLRFCMRRKTMDLLTRLHRQVRSERMVAFSLDQPPRGTEEVDHHQFIGNDDPNFSGIEQVDLPSAKTICSWLGLSPAEEQCLMDSVLYPRSTAAERENRLQRSYKSWDNAMSRVRKKSRAWGKHHPNEYQNLWSAF